MALKEHDDFVVKVCQEGDFENLAKRFKQEFGEELVVVQGPMKNPFAPGAAGSNEDWDWLIVFPDDDICKESRTIPRMDGGYTSVIIWGQDTFLRTDPFKKHVDLFLSFPREKQRTVTNMYAEER